MRICLTENRQQDRAQRNPPQSSQAHHFNTRISPNLQTKVQSTCTKKDTHHKLRSTSPTRSCATMQRYSIDIRSSQTASPVLQHMVGILYHYFSTETTKIKGVNVHAHRHANHLRSIDFYAPISMDFDETTNSAPSNKKYEDVSKSKEKGIKKKGFHMIYIQDFYLHVLIIMLVLQF